MDATELHDLFRIEMHDVEEPYFFESASIYTYINDAQSWFCRLTEGIEDARSTILALTPGVEWYSTPKSMLKLRAAYRLASGRAVDIVNQEQAHGHGVCFNGATGPLRALVAGAEKNKLRAWPVPNQIENVQLEIFRLPKPVGEGDSLEIDDQHHLPLLLWVKHLAYGNADSEIFDRRKSEEFESKFQSYCAKARAEQTRSRRQVGVTQYGGY